MIPVGILAAAALRSGSGGGGAPSIWAFDPARHDLNIALSDGNMSATGIAGGHRRAFGTHPKPRAGKWIVEFHLDAIAVGGDIAFGLTGAAASVTESTYPATQGQTAFWSRLSGSLARLYNGNGSASYSALPSVPGNVAVAGDVVGIAVDFDASTMEAYKNGVLLGEVNVVLANQQYVPYVAMWGSASNPTIVSVRRDPQHPVQGYAAW